jgi:hypothetical protein
MNLTQEELDRAMSWDNSQTEQQKETPNAQAEADAAAQALLDAAATQEADDAAKLLADEQAKAAAEAAANEEKTELSLLEKLKATAEEKPIVEEQKEVKAEEAKAPIVVEPSEDEKLLLKLKESGKTILDLAKAIQITDYSKMDTDDLIRINLEKQYGENGVTAEILGKETVGFENMLPSQQAAYLNSIKTTLGQEVNYGNEVTEYLDGVLAKKPNQAPIKTQAEIDAEIKLTIDNNTKEDLAALNSTLEKIGIPPDSETATSLLSEYSYERAFGYVKNGKLDAVTFLDHAFKIKDYENADKRGYERGVKETTAKLSSTGASTATKTAESNKPLSEQIKEHLIQ